jgi:hypothetical protein
MSNSTNGMFNLIRQAFPTTAGNGAECCDGSPSAAECCDGIIADDAENGDHGCRGSCAEPAAGASETAAPDLACHVGCARD